MMTEKAFYGWRAWLLAETPESALQARLSRFYLSWLSFKRNPLAVIGLLIVVFLVLIALFAPWLSHHLPTEQNLADRLQSPSSTYWLGTDELGRDIYSRIIHGSKITLYIIFLVAVIVVPLGLFVGTTAGYFGGIIDKILMRITDIFMAFPRLILALAFVAVMGPSIENAVIAITITS